MANEHIYTVREITRRIRGKLESEFPDVWVEGEVSNLKKTLSGHLYFCLKDEESQLNAAVFGYLERNFKFTLEEGLQIVAHGRINVYERQGKYQLIIDKMEPAGKGALQLAFEQLKEKLEKEGLFDPSHKKSIPLLPEKIGVVTSPSGAAIRDILNVIGRRFPNMEVILYPVRVQGKEAPPEIAEAVKSFNQREDIDVLIVGRGGGSIEDLWAFNEEIVARAIYASRIPIISAVGHEIDFTIADFVADLRAQRLNLLFPIKKIW
ncbi:Exodeoxyribonuclease 7 large subunit [subsurface metagenome]